MPKKKKEPNLAYVAMNSNRVPCPVDLSDYSFNSDEVRIKNIIAINRFIEDTIIKSRSILAAHGFPYEDGETWLDIEMDKIHELEATDQIAYNAYSAYLFVHKLADLVKSDDTVNATACAILINTFIRDAQLPKVMENSQLGMRFNKGVNQQKGYQTEDKADRDYQILGYARELKEKHGWKTRRIAREIAQDMAWWDSIAEEPIGDEGVRRILKNKL